MYELYTSKTYIEGASQFVKNCDMCPKSIILQVVDNNLTKDGPVKSFEKMERLVEECRRRFDCPVWVVEPLARVLESEEATTTYNMRAEEMSRLLQSSTHVKLIRLPSQLKTASESHFRRDNFGLVHLNDRGRAALASAYKKCVLGIDSAQRNSNVVTDNAPALFPGHVPPAAQPRTKSQHVRFDDSNVLNSQPSAQSHSEQPASSQPQASQYMQLMTGLQSLLSGLMAQAGPV